MNYGNFLRDIADYENNPKLYNFTKRAYEKLKMLMYKEASNGGYHISFDLFECCPCDAAPCDALFYLTEFAENDGIEVESYYPDSRKINFWW